MTAIPDSRPQVSPDASGAGCSWPSSSAPSWRGPGPSFTSSTSATPRRSPRTPWPTTATRRWPSRFASRTSLEEAALRCGVGRAGRGVHRQRVGSGERLLLRTGRAARSEQPALALFPRGHRPQPGRPSRRPPLLPARRRSDRGGGRNQRHAAPLPGGDAAGPGPVGRGRRTFPARAGPPAGRPPAHYGLGLLAIARDDWAGSRDHSRRCLGSPQAQQKACVQLAAVSQRLGDDAGADKFRTQADRLPKDLDWNDPYVTEYLKWGVKRQPLPAGRRPGRRQSIR